MTRKVVRAADRHHWRNEWLESWQSFPATGNFDLVGNAHGVLMVHNDDRVDAGEGLDVHHHRDTEIVTWVLDGTLHHRDSTGNEGDLTPGVVQRMTAGRGISHAEGNPASRSEDAPLRVVQMWVAPERAGLEPGYAEKDFSADLASGDLVTVVSGLATDASGPALSIANPFVALHVARLHAGTSCVLPAAEYGHLYVARGAVELPDGATLDEGDAVRTTDEGPLTVGTDAGAEILFWEMHAAFDR
ncbi:pirin family protein [Gordonia sp. NPDC003585]|uniref:pirin family protein n=1 Tax=Gordonia sp. NPDC003585 TaxID=3154275 RepID=UPI0033A06326